MVMKIQTFNSHVIPSDIDYVILTIHAAPLNRLSFIMMNSYTCLFTNLISLIFIQRTWERQSFDPFRDLFLVFLNCQVFVKLWL